MTRPGGDPPPPPADRAPGERSRALAAAIVRGASTPIGQLFTISAIVFVAETLVMLFLMPAVVTDEYHLLGSVIDAGIMVSLSVPFLWWLIARQQRAKNALETLNQTLEERVRQRTQALQVREQDLILSNEELKQRNCQLLEARSQAATDALTLLPNHRAFQNRIRDEVSHAAAGGSSVGLIMLDIDGFKRFNDSLGHLAGDDVLRRCSRICVEALGPHCTYRYGGDEFVVILTGADEQQTAAVAEQLRSAVAAEVGGTGPGLTVSLGVAAFPSTAASAEELIYKADAAMYLAKSAGKNRVARWEEKAGAHSKSSRPMRVSARRRETIT